MNIGYANPGYPVVRTILGKCKEASYTRVRPFSSIGSNIASKIGARRLASDLMFSYFGGINGLKVDLLHFFNTIPLTNVKKPFITTFETTVPRFFSKGWMYRNALKSIISDRCKKLLALSECTKNLQKKLFELEGMSATAGKIEVLHPPQDLLVSRSEVENKEIPAGEMVFIFVGRAFWHKGGGHCVRVLKRLKKHHNIKLRVVGDIRDNDYMNYYRYDDEQAMRKMIDENRSWIEYYPSLPNCEVLKMIRNADVGLLPTRGDTYGYSVLEMQAAGLPCITTDLRALPEINNLECGWLINIPKDDSCNAKFGTQEEKDFLCETIELQLEKICEEVVSCPEILKEKSLNAIDRVKACHDPVMYSEKIMKFYEEVLA